MNSLCEKILAGERPDVDTFIDAFGTLMPLLHELKYTQQDEEWHAEGDVHTHTDMVLEELYDILDEEASHLDDEQQLTLILAALLHDICKPVCTREKEIRGELRLVSPHHEHKGRCYIAVKLIELELPYLVVNQVMNLVGYHQKPRQFVLDDAGDASYRYLSRLCSLELFYWLEQADIRGRECYDKQAQLEVLELFKMQAQDFDLWWVNDSYDQWLDYFQEQLAASDDDLLDHIMGRSIQAYEAGLIQSREEALARSYALQKGFPHFIMMCGPSGSGKSRWISRNADDSAVVISLDELRQEIGGKRSSQKYNGQVMQLAREKLKRALCSKQTVIWDATCLRQDQRTRLLCLAHDYNAMSTIVVFHSSAGNYAKGNNSRKYAVPNSVLSKQIESFQFPDLNEAHRLQVCDHRGEELFSSGFFTSNLS